MAYTAHDLQPLLRGTENRLFGAEDTVCLERAWLITEADKAFATDSLVVRRAKSLRHILANMTLDLKTNPIMAGNTSSAPRAWMLLPEFGLEVNGQIALEHDIPLDWLARKVPSEIVDYWRPRAIGNTPGGCAGIGHMSIDFDRLVNGGLQAVLDELAGIGDSGTTAEREYRQAMTIACQAVIEWAERYAAAAEMLAESSEDAVAAACYERVAAACRHVPRLPARDYFEGLQSMLLMHLATIIEGQGLSQSIGLPDRALRRFDAEVAADPRQAAQLTSAFLLGVAANSYQGRGSKTQAITVGGADARGRDACNAITRAFLAAFGETPVNDPHLFLRWHQGIDPEVTATAMQMLSNGRSMPLLINDHQAATALEDCDVQAADAWDYCICGCNEIGIPGRCTVSAFAMGAALVDVQVLHDCIESVPQPRTANALVEAYEAATERLLQESVLNSRRRIEHLAQIAPFPLTSACCDGCVKVGADYLLAMPYRDLATVFARGTANAINTLAAIDDIISQRHLVASPAELLQRLRQDDDDEVKRWIQQSPKWATDDDRADQWAVALHEARQRAIERVEERLGLPILVCHVIRSLHHMSGRHMPATIDGRGKGEPLAASIGAQQGSGREAPTALLGSVVKLDARRYYRGVYNLNLTLPAGQISAAIVGSLCETFFAGGGQELQVAVLSPQQLRAAQRDPQAHRDLVVRIAGLNARFVELSAIEQSEIIGRAETAQAM